MSAETAQAKTTVESQKKWLVTEGDRIGELARGNKDWKHQLRTIWEAARLETEPLVVLNLLRYQAARNQGNWHTPVDVHEPVRAAIETCRQRAHDDAELAMELIRHLLAYTYRAFTYYSTEKSSPQPPPCIKEGEPERRGERSDAVFAGDASASPPVPPFKKGGLGGISPEEAPPREKLP